MADKKKATPPRISPVRAEKLQKGPKIAGRAKGNLAERKAQNVGVKDGTVRIGKSGKSYNVYDAATGTWRRGVVRAATPTKPTTRKSAEERREPNAMPFRMPDGAGLPAGTTRVIRGKRYQWRGVGGGWRLMPPGSQPKR